MLFDPAGDDLVLDVRPALTECQAEAPAGEKQVSPDAEPPLPKPSSTVKGAYPSAATVPTQHGPHGIRYDFNFGARITLPTGSKWTVRLSDADTGNTLFESSNDGAVINSSKRYYIKFRIEIWKDGVLCFDHLHDCSGRDVLVQFPVGTLGDIIAWIPYAAKFARAHDCRLTCALSGLIIPLLGPAYPDIRFVTHEDFEKDALAGDFYSTYSMGLFFDDTSFHWQPCDFRLVGLHRTAGHILGVDPAEERPDLVLPDNTRPIEEPYVVIAVQSSSQAKYWNNPNGWSDVVSFLKKAGYRVVCIDQKRVHGGGLVWNHLPHGVEDQTGDRPLLERARWLRHATAFIGLSSGLSWLAWACGTPTVMISGFTHPSNEFDTPFRVINYHACNSCWNDIGHRFNHTDFLWCPRHAGTARQFECTRLITSHQVIRAIERIPDCIPTSTFRPA